MNKIENEYELLYYIQERDSDYPIELLLEKYEAMIKAIVRKLNRIHNISMDVESLCQEGRIALIKASIAYSGLEKTKLSTYFYYKVEFALKNIIRKSYSLKEQANYNNVYLDDDSKENVNYKILVYNSEKLSIKANYELEEEYYRIHNLLKQEESILINMYIQGFDKKEIIEILELDYNKYRNKLFRIKEKIKKNIE